MSTTYAEQWLQTRGPNFGFNIPEGASHLYRNKFEDFEARWRMAASGSDGTGCGAYREAMSLIRGLPHEAFTREGSEQPFRPNYDSACFLLGVTLCEGLPRSVRLAGFETTTSFLFHPTANQAKAGCRSPEVIHDLTVETPHITAVESAKVLLGLISMVLECRVDNTHVKTQNHQVCDQLLGFVELMYLVCEARIGFEMRDMEDCTSVLLPLREDLLRLLIHHDCYERIQIEAPDALLYACQEYLDICLKSSLAGQLPSANALLEHPELWRSLANKTKIFPPSIRYHLHSLNKFVVTQQIRTAYKA